MNASGIKSSISRTFGQVAGMPAALLVLLSLAALEILCFARPLSLTGFYLDDWLMLSQLTFGPQNVWDATISLLTKDFRVAIRPLEAPYFSILYFLFGINPLGYHALNAILEVLSAWFLYLALKQFTAREFMPTIAALTFLLYPTHDVTHYWMVASSITLSGLLYSISLWLSVRATQFRRNWLHLLSGLAYALSLFNHELFLPLIVLNALLVFQISRRGASLIRAVRYGLCAMAPHIIACLAVWYYQFQLVANWFHHVRAQEIKLDVGTFTSAIAEGLKMCFSPYAFGFFWEQAALSTQQANCYFFILLSIALTLIALRRSLLEDDPASGARSLVVLGLVSAVCAYSIFGISTGYIPRLDTIVNRINTAATIGISILIAGLIGCLLQLLWQLAKVKFAPKALTACLSCFLMAFFVMTNLALSEPWIAATQMQNKICSLVDKESSRLRTKTSIMLARVPRYVKWSPMFDGIWDFQSMVRIKLNDPKAIAGVMSDRIKFSATDVKDISQGVLCGTYPFKNMIVLTLDPLKAVDTNNVDEFVEAVR